MELHPSQIVYLSHRDSVLYAEVIQMAIARPLCWVRPLALVKPLDESQADDNTVAEAKIFNLKEGSDLLWPATLFQAALDTDVIPLLAILETEKHIQSSSAIAQQELRHFIQSVWEAHASIFEEFEKP